VLACDLEAEDHDVLADLLLVHELRGHLADHVGGQRDREVVGGSADTREEQPLLLPGVLEAFLGGGGDRALPFHDAALADPDAARGRKHLAFALERFEHRLAAAELDAPIPKPYVRHSPPRAARRIARSTSEMASDPTETSRDRNG
jgi:hypothetical protein